jgi:hypothetical protein
VQSEKYASHSASTHAGIRVIFKSIEADVNSAIRGDFKFNPNATDESALHSEKPNPNSTSTNTRH